MANEDHFLRQWEKFLGEDCRITRITPQNILAYRSGLLNRKRRPCTKRTVNLHTRALKQLLLLARTEGQPYEAADGGHQATAGKARRASLTEG